jgi:hypothetical protein
MIPDYELMRFYAPVRRGRGEAFPGCAESLSSGRPGGHHDHGCIPIEIFYQKGGREILFQKENVGALYRVYLNRPHKPADELYPLFYGDSVGHWEGNVLVVDTVSLGATSAFDLITPHSDALHVVQHLRRRSYDTLEDEITFDDPKALTMPITATAVFKLHTDWELEEYECTNERLIFDEHGNQSISKAVQP